MSDRITKMSDCIRFPTGWNIIVVWTLCIKVLVFTTWKVKPFGYELQSKSSHMLSLIV